MIKYFVKAVTSEYVDKQGETKKRYSTIGTVFEMKRGGLMMSLESIPIYGLKEGKLLCYLNVPEESDKSVKPSNPNTIADDSLDVPF